MVPTQQLTYARCAYSDNPTRTVAVTLKQAQQVLTWQGGGKERAKPIQYLAQHGNRISCWAGGTHLADIAYSGLRARWFICEEVGV